MQMTQIHEQSGSTKINSNAIEIQFGPATHCAALIWECLVDFTTWPQWQSFTHSVRQLDSGPTGRGSLLQIDGRHGKQIWEVIHWDPPRRLDFEVNAGQLRCGYSFTIGLMPDRQFARLELAMEFLNEGNVTLLNTYTKRQQRKLGKRFVAEFSALMESKLKSF